MSMNFSQYTYPVQCSSNTVRCISAYELVKKFTLSQSTLKAFYYKLQRMDVKSYLSRLYITLIHLPILIQIILFLYE